MSVTITRVDGKVYSINITSEHVKPFLKSLDLLIDILIDSDSSSFKSFQEDKDNEALFLVAREY